MHKRMEYTKRHIRTSAVLDAETSDHYWLTVTAQDHGVVPLSSSLQVLVEVAGVNDNVPLTTQPVYRVSVPENCPAGRLVAQLHAEDADLDSDIAFHVASGNSQRFFAVRPRTGEILTTARPLDRELQDEHVLEVVVSDGELNSTTRVVIAVEDENDHAPVFLHAFHKVRVLATSAAQSPQILTGGQDAPEEADAAADSFIENMPWETFDAHALLGPPVLRVLALDADAGDNGLVQYSIRSGRGGVSFQIHPDSGEVHATQPLLPGQEFQLRVRAEDRGAPRRWSEARVTLQVVAAPQHSARAPVVANPQQSVRVMEADPAGFLVAVVQTSLLHQHQPLFYDIIGGDDGKEFHIGRDKGNILLARQLDHETKSEYSLNVSVTDGAHVSYAQVKVSVLDNNEHAPRFTQPQYAVDVSEAVPSGTAILQLRASDGDRLQRLSYSVHLARDVASAAVFRVDPASGAVYLNASLDREVQEQHVLVVCVRDEGAPSKRDYARLVVTVHDHNDHPPEFPQHLVEARVHDTAAVGSVLARLVAVDRDRGHNARLTYSIVSGNVGNAFAIEPRLGDVSVSKPLDRSAMSEYVMIVKATDGGSPALSSTVHLHVAVTMADNAPPRFSQQDYSAEMYENEPAGKYVTHVQVKSMSSLLFEVVDGGQDAFSVNPSSGVIVTTRQLDYEAQRFYNLTVQATNMAGVSRRCAVSVHVLDRNDNAPRFPKTSYSVEVSESLPPGSLLMLDGRTPLVVAADDADSGPNGIVVHSIVESLAAKIFHVHPRTGAVRTAAGLDREAAPHLVFHVEAEDRGRPRLRSQHPAEVRVSLLDHGDCAPVFERPRYRGVVALPARPAVAVVEVSAADRDSSGPAPRYDVVDGDPGGAFALDAASGLLTVARPAAVAARHTLHVRASDGRLSTIAQIDVFGVASDDPAFRFQKERYEAMVQENSSRVLTLAVLNVLGLALNEHITFTLLTPSDMFSVGSTSGAVRTTGRPFDREVVERHELLVQAMSGDVTAEHGLRLAVTTVSVAVLDVNDNCPVFVQLPYHSIVSADARKWDVVARVRAVDADAGENGDVRYELARGHGELFKVDRKTGDVQLKQNLDGHLRRLDAPCGLTIAAYDGGVVPCSTEATVLVEVRDKSLPAFERRQYSASVPENAEPGSPLPLALRADAPPGHRLVYNVVSGDDDEQFALDFRTAPNSDNGPCVLYLADELDREHKSVYHLTVQAVDAVTGAESVTTVHIAVEDVNDSAPEFSSDSYAVSVLESAPPGSALLSVTARDNDTGMNQVVRYEIVKDAVRSSEYFHIDPENGTVYLTRSLDHEVQTSHVFSVVAADSGAPRLSSIVRVHVSVEDVNDNAPVFERPEYACAVWAGVGRGHFVTKVSASDADHHALTYAIVGGDDLHSFSVHPSTGIVTVATARGGPATTTLLEVEASDGVHSGVARVRLEPLPENLHAPQFQRPLLEARVLENQPSGAFVSRVAATDGDPGPLGRPSYSIPSDLARETFRVDKHTGVVTTRRPLDRERQAVHEVPVIATDGGGKSGHLLLRVKVGDQNDNPPKFLLRQYTAAIRSDAAPTSTPFLQVKATDDDEGMSAEVEYSIYQTQLSGVKDIFGINRHTGDITLLRSAISLENQVLGFFVRAQDRGTPSLHEEVPVEVAVVGPQEQPPVFEKTDGKFFVAENSPPGTAVAQLRLAGDPADVAWRLVSAEPELFSVDAGGRLRVAAPLDREAADSHEVGVLAETRSGRALAEISVQLLDEDDNPPVFHSPLYRVSVAEDVPPGTSLLRVSAVDDDEGAAGEVRYSLSPDAGVFAVHAHSGWLTTAAPLDREARPEHLLHVAASSGRHHSTAAVIVRLIDCNDNPPVFSRAHYVAAVKEGAPAGTVVLRLETTDDDAGPLPPLQYHVTEGDPGLLFAVRNGGDLVVARTLDREHAASHQLEVTASDGKFASHAAVTVHVLDDNDNPPVCAKDSYREDVSEDAAPGVYVLRVLATDADEGHNSRIHFRLVGEGAEDFSLDKDTGELRTAAPLDRESRAVYELEARAEDAGRPSWGCTSRVRIHVADVNDNPPRFSADRYSAALPEDAAVGALVVRVRAVDPDLGASRRVRYSLSGDDDGHLSVSAAGGLVRLARPLDRRLRPLHNVTVVARDAGSPPLEAAAPLVVVVLAAGDSPPQFAARAYRAALREDAAPGAEVALVRAASSHAAAATLRYAIVGGNEHGRFGIDAETGRVVTSGRLDYERAREYVLTVQAADGGTPQLASYASVHVAVLDANDNAPAFSQSAYTARVAEDVRPGHPVVQVLASDADSETNGRISYSIAKGDPMKQFAVDENTGLIAVSGKLDRETVPGYALEVRARDAGVPSLAGVAVVNVEVLDSNDNPPVFSQHNYSALVQESTAVGWAVLELAVSDADLAPNVGPFTFDVVSGNEQHAFSLGEDGVLRTAARLQHRDYVLNVKVFDSGQPPLSAHTFVFIKVVEESQFPPVINPLQIFINSYMEEFSGGVIGRVHATDRDQYDTLSYSITSDLFTIAAENGTLSALPQLDVGEYKVNVSVTDGKFSSRTTVKVSVETISEEMVHDAIMLKFRGITPLDFVLSHKKGFQHAVRGPFNVRSKDVIVISIQPSNDEPRVSSRNVRRGQEAGDNLNVLFTVRKHQESPDDPAFHPPDVVRATLTRHVEELELTTGLIVEEIVPNKCTASHCSHGECDDRVVLDARASVLVATERISFVFPHYQHQLICICKEGYVGDRCERPADECWRRPCAAPRLCEWAGAECRCGDVACYAPRSPLSFSGRGYAQFAVDPAAARGVLGDRLVLALSLRTLQPTSTLLHAAGRLEYAVLEVVNGVVQYRFELGCGEGVVRAGQVLVSDGAWHHVAVERELSDAQLTVDGEHVARGSSPGRCRVLSVQPDRVYLGAEVRPHPTVLGFEDLQRGFVGCVDDVVVSRQAAPLHVGGAGGSVVLRRLANVELGCAELRPLGVCARQPCLNGGTCRSSGEEAYSCECHPRFAGPDCGLDTDPCSSSPCLHGGHCKPASSEGSYSCECPAGLSGARCQTGYYCSPSPCLNGGSCEEGDSGPVCTCQGFSGDLCGAEVDECSGGGRGASSGPCRNGATCVNEPGAFRCVCPPNVTGLLCAEPLHPSRISSSARGVTRDEAVGITLGLAAILLAAAAFVAYRRFRPERSRRPACHINNETGKARDAAKLSGDDFRRVSKLVNLEVTQVAGPCQQRPVAYLACGNHEASLNNLDSSRGHGEDVPPDYLRNLDRSRQPAAWANHVEPGQAAPRVASKINNDLRVLENIQPRMPATVAQAVCFKSQNGSGERRETLPGACTNSSEAESHNSGGHRWSSPMWARSSNPLPDIAEIPGREVVGSSRSHSDESNASTPPLPAEEDGATRDDKTACRDGVDPRPAAGEDVLPGGEHEASRGGGAAVDDEDEDVEPYGFPSSRPGDTRCVVTLLARAPGDDDRAPESARWSSEDVSQTSL